MSEKKKWVRVTALQNIPLREGRSVQVGGHHLAIFNLGDRFLTVENRCAHRAGPLADGIVSGGTVVCPLHAWKIDLATGSVTNRPDNPQCVKTFRTRVEEGVISVEVGVAGFEEGKPSVDCPGSASRNLYVDQTASGGV
jgi:nitrite reductase (NADH) small subunit